MSSPNNDPSAQRVEQVKNELVRVLDRYVKESDLTVLEVVGILEHIKFAFLKARYDHKD